MLAMTVFTPLAAQAADAANAIEVPGGASAAAAVAPDAASGAVALSATEVTAQSDVQVPTEQTGSYTIQKSTSATKLNLSPKETPQSQSVVTRQEMQDWNLNGIGDVLSHTTGVTVDRFETDRTNYTARGFDITNFQFDGVGMPLVYGTMYGDLDMAMFDRVEIVRGADGLNASTGNPSATVNFIRKRPTYDFQASADVSYGSWNTKRVDADISGPLNKAGTLAARLVVSHEDGNSYMHNYRPSSDMVYGVIEANLSDTSLLTLGYSYQKRRAKGTMWGGLPILDANNQQIVYGVNSGFGADWMYFNTEEQRAFLEFNQQLNHGWQWKSTVAYNEIKSDSVLFYPDGAPDFSTDTGFGAYTTKDSTLNKQVVLDTNVSGKYTLFGREHDLVAGVSFARSEMNYASYYATNMEEAVSVSSVYSGTVAEPSFDSSPDDTGHYTNVQRKAYISTRLNLSDRAKLLLGANYTQSDTGGVQSGANQDAHSSSTSPYFGFTYDITREITGYASLTKIFNPQYEGDLNGKPIGDAYGRNLEAGVKGAFLQNRLNLSAAVFRVKQTNIAEDLGTSTVTGQEYYRGINAVSQGIELDGSGQITRDWNVSAGATIMRMVDDDGNSTRTYVPRKMLHLSTTYRLPYFDRKLTVGGNIRWQAATRYEGDAVNIKQGAYAQVDVMARYEINKHLTLTANINNIFNKKYWTTLYYDRSIYAAPVNASVNLAWKY